MQKILMMPIVAVMFMGPYAHAGKVDDVQSAVKSACGKDLGKDEALRLVKDLFLSCVPGDKVDVSGCAVGCLKANEGAVVGK